MTFMENGTIQFYFYKTNELFISNYKGRETPNEITQNEMVERLRDLETSAMIKHIGIWSESDPDRIAGLRAKQRSEDQELKELQSQVKKPQLPQSVLDLNTASKKELESIKGIGPVLAERILAGRLYVTIDDLLNVKGIGQKKLDYIRPYFVVGKKPLINEQSKEE
jgi:DNA uptake protein ComE-like DNA-binding protein